MKKYLLSIFFFSILNSSKAQSDTAFWFAAPDIEILNHPIYGPYDRPIFLRLTSFTSAANVTISIPANPGFIPINITIPANSTNTVNLTPWIDLIENSDPVNVSNKGIYIQSTTDITAYYEINSTTCNCNPEFFSLKGRNALGNEFYIPSQVTWSIDTIRIPNAKTGFDIVATENNTTVTVTPTKALIGRPANVPFTITLNRGQSYACIGLYRNGGSMLNGSKVVSDKPVAVTHYEDLLFSDGPCADLAGDQLIPTSIFGTEFAIVRGNLTTRDKVVVTASQNNTNIYLNGSGTATATINAGQSYEYDMTPAIQSLYIQTDKAAGVYHYTGTGCEVGSAVIPKLTCTGSSSVSLVRSNNGGIAIVMLVTKNGNQGNFLVNGAAGIITAANFTPLPGTGGAYVYAKKDVTSAMPLNTATTFSNTSGKFQLGFFNETASTGGCMYGFFSDFKKSNVTTSQTEVCKFDSVQLNATGGITYQWSPAAGLSNPNISNPKASPAVTTDYKVIITDIDGCIDSAFVKVIVNICSSSPCDSWLYTPAVNSNARIGDLDIPGNQLTVEASFIRTGPVNPVGGYGFLVSKHITVGDINYALWPGGCAISTVNGDVWAQENCPFQLNTTYHVAMVYDGTFLKYYRNGFLHSQTPASGNLIQNNYLAAIAQNVPEGAPTIFPFIGYMNEVRIWNVARTQAELQTYMNASIPNPSTQTGLKGYYVFDNLLNKQGNAAYNATLNGAASINATNPNCTFTPDPGLVANAGIDTSFCSNTPVSHVLQGNGNGTYSWSPAIYLDNPNIQNPTATVNSTTTFYLSVSSAGFCSVMDSVTIFVNPLPSVQTLTDTAICKFSPLVLSTTSNATVFQWSPAIYVSNPAIANPAFIDTASHRLYVTVTAAAGCSATDSIDITVNPLPVVSTLADTTICLNQTITLSANGAQTYAWTPPAGLSNPAIANPVFSGTSNQTYIVTGTDVNGCEGTDLINIYVSSPTSFNAPPSKMMCQQKSVQLDGNNGTRVSYLWSPAAYLSNNTIINPFANPPQTTLYTLVVTDNSCGYDSTFTTQVTVLPAPVVSAGKSNDIDCTIHSATLNATGGNQYTWSPSTGLNSTTISYPVASPATTQKYIVLVTDASGCTNTDSVTVFVNTGANIGKFMPNSFTPNGDGLNDCYGLKNWGQIQQLQFYIFNRYGEQVFATANPGKCWDGTYKGKRALAGTYVYVIKATTDCGTEEQKGNFMLIR